LVSEPVFIKHPSIERLEVMFPEAHTVSVSISLTDNVLVLTSLLFIEH
jgi:hypothetical protein